MKKLFLMLVITLCGSSAFSKNVVTLANGEWPPYHSKSMKHYGLASHLIKEAFALEGIDVEYQFLPWKRGMKMAENGELNGTALWRNQAEFQDEFYYSDPVLMSETVFFHLKANPFHWHKFEDLKGINIGGTLGYSYNEDYRIAEKSKEYRIQRMAKDELNFSMLLRKRIDIFPITKEVGYFLLQSKYTAEEASLITHHETSLTPENERSLHLLLSKDNKDNIELMEAFNKGLNKLKQTGRYDSYILDLKNGKYLNKHE